MHELALTQPIVEIAVEKAVAAGATKISKIVIIIGTLSGAEPHAIDFCFQALSEGTLAEGAELLIETDHCMGTCRQCDHKFVVEKYDYACPKCDSFEIIRDGGERFYLKEIEIETFNKQN
ncbi:hydrogenase maturation nickel metallochaperone HypA [Pseudomonadota bacterium]